jgi:hypothetical protein
METMYDYISYNPSNLRYTEAEKADDIPTQTFTGAMTSCLCSFLRPVHTAGIV